MTDISDAQKFSKYRLRGEPLPPDLAIIFANRDEFYERTGLLLLPEPDWEPWADTSYLSAEDLTNPHITANIQAIAEVSKFISFIAANGGGEYLGYWHGPETRTVAESSVVLLDTEGQFNLCCGLTFVDAVLWHCVYAQDELSEWKSWLSSVGLKAVLDSTEAMPEPMVQTDPQKLCVRLYEEFLKVSLDER